MASTVTARPNHYQLLGLAPTATGEEIARAFAREIGRPRALGGLAPLSIAHETLRDPGRRRAYDVAIGLAPEPAAQAAPAAGWAASPYLLRASAQLAEPQVAPRPAPPSEPQPRREPPAETELPSFIARSLSELARPEPLSGPAPLPPRAAEPDAEPPAVQRVDLALDERDAALPQWRRIGLGAGALVVAVALVGAWAGSPGRSAAEPKPASVTALLAPPTTFTLGDPAAAPRAREAARPTPALRPAKAAARAAPPRPKARLADLAAQLADPAPAGDPAPAVAEAPAVPAALPLPKTVVARTIARIGYPCGSVASATPGETAGTFTVTCTSGHSYRAAPVRGRYHFRRLGGG